MQILCLTGWQQPAESLRELAPNAQHFDYKDFSEANALFSALPKTVDVAIGWSLGGQLLVRAIANGAVKAKKLVLLGAAFQCIADKHFTEGIKSSDYQSLKTNYVAGKEEFLKTFNGQMAVGSPNEKRIITKLNSSLRMWKNGLFWLEELEKFSCFHTDFSHFPETVIVHGENDKIINVQNADLFGKYIPDAKVVRLTTGHASHLSHEMLIKNLI